MHHPDLQPPCTTQQSYRCRDTRSSAGSPSGGHVTPHAGSRLLGEQHVHVWSQHEGCGGLKDILEEHTSRRYEQTVMKVVCDNLTNELVFWERKKRGEGGEMWQTVMVFNNTCRVCKDELRISWFLTSFIARKAFVANCFNIIIWARNMRPCTSNQHKRLWQILMDRKIVVDNCF